jgi:hypothetical protein
MRLLSLLLIVQVVSAAAYGQGRASLVGETQDCFAGKLIHPARVDVILFDSPKGAEISAILNDLDKQAPTRNDQNVAAFFASYERLKSAIRNTEALAHTQSDNTGRFSFRGLKSGAKVLLLGFAEREDDPAYYTYTRFTLQPGRNSVRLDFNRGVVCEASGPGF